MRAEATAEEEEEEESWKITPLRFDRRRTRPDQNGDNYEYE